MYLLLDSMHFLFLYEFTASLLAGKQHRVVKMNVLESDPCDLDL